MKILIDTNVLIDYIANREPLCDKELGKTLNSKSVSGIIE